MKAQKKRLIAVLGMHRSGTSAIARGLQVLGVPLGDRLVPPRQADNPTGFWEDLDICALNIEMLSTLGGDWDRLSAIGKDEVEALRKGGFFLRAAELLRAKLASRRCFGFKDPRTTKLLPIWKRVFAHCRYEASYVLCLRHPTSVARSLEKRDGFAAEKSYLLWLDHMLQSLSGTSDSRRVLVDYDRLMQEPGRELQRMAKGLGLKVHPAALAEYQSEFLDPALRHTAFGEEDLALDEACPPLVREVYAALQGAAADEANLDSAAFRQQLAGWARELARLEPALSLADKLSARQSAVASALAEREASYRTHVADLEKAVGERDIRTESDRKATGEREASHRAHVAELEAAVAGRDAAHRAHAAELEAAVTARDARVAGLQQSIAERDAQIAGVNGTIADLNRSIAERETAHQARVAALDTTAAARDAQLADLERMLSQREAAHRAHAAELETAVSARDAQLAEREARQLAHVRELELAVDERDRAKAQREAGYQAHVADLEKAVFAEQQARILQTTELQRQLKELRSSFYWQMTYPLRALDRLSGKALKFLRGGSRPIVAKAALLPAIEPQRLPAADGKWEWADYDVVKARIDSAKAARRDAFVPVPADMIDLGGKPLAAAAQRIALPDPGEAPDVSIILPVYNNLQLTLECLQSIASRTEPSVSYEVIVADDASTDETPPVLAAIPHLRLSRNAENLGFLRNCNRVLPLVRGRYVLYLNNDVQVTPGWLKGLLDTFTLSPRAGAAGPRIVYPRGHLQEAGAALRPDGTPVMVGLNEDPAQPRYAYARRVDYVSGACLMVPTPLLRRLGGFADEYAPCYCEDSDLCLRIEQAGYDVYYNPAATIMHHLSRSTAAIDDSFKMRCVTTNLATLASKWAPRFAQAANPRVLAFYLPQFHPIPENNLWWGEGFTEWTNVSKAKPNFTGHYMPRLPADLGHYDLRLPEVMTQQAALAQRYGVHGFCFYYYWFGGKRLLEAPLEQMLALGKPDFPFCLCWANENWTRRWDGEDQEILMAQSHSPEDDLAVIADLARYFRDARYIRVDGRPLILVYRVTRFPDFAATAARWRAWCRENGIGEIYITLVESFELVHAGTHPSVYGCDAAMEFPPQELAEPKPPSGALTNPAFEGRVADYRDLAVRFATRPAPAYTRFMGVAAGWDNTARSQDRSFCFEHATPGAFQAWLTEAVEQTRLQQSGDERLIFVNAWNEWAECAYLEPDRRFGHTYLEAVRNALDGWLLR